MKEYISYICKKCNKEFVVLTSELEDTVRNGNYIACPHCGSKHIKQDRIEDSLKECMSERSYIRSKHGAIKQVK